MSRNGSPRSSTKELSVGQWSGAEALGGVIQRLLEQNIIVFAWLECSDGLVVVGLPVIKHVLHGEEVGRLLRKDSVGRRCTYGWQFNPATKP